MSQAGCSAGVTEPFALRVIGDSMAPEFNDGNIIIVDPGHPLKQGAYVVLEVEQQVYFGQFHQDSQGARLQHLHPDYPSIHLDQGFTLKGVVIQRSTGRRKDLKHYEYQ